MRHIFKLIGRGLYSWELIQDFPNDWFLFLKLDQQKEWETLFFPVIFLKNSNIFKPQNYALDIYIYYPKRKVGVGQRPGNEVLISVQYTRNQAHGTAALQVGLMEI